MSVRIRVCTTIKAAPADVWDLVAQIDRHVDWMGDAERITFRHPATNELLEIVAPVPEDLKELLEAVEAGLTEDRGLRTED